MLQVGVVEAGEHGHRDDLGGGRCRALGSRHHRLPAGAWTVRIAGSSVSDRRDRLGNRVGNVVELEVEEDRQSRAPRSGARPRGLAREEFKAELHAAGDFADVAHDSAARSTSGVSIATKIGFNQPAPVPRRPIPEAVAARLRSSARSGGGATRPGAHRQPRRKEANQEREQQQDGQFDIGLDVAPQAQLSRRQLRLANNTTITARRTQKRVFKNCMVARFRRHVR